MRMTKQTLLAVVAFVLVTFTTATGAFAIPADAQGLFNSDDLPGATINVHNVGSQLNLDPINLEAYLPISSLGQVSTWSIPWTSAITGPSYYSGHTPDDFTVLFLNADKGITSAATLTNLPWMTPGGALIAASALTLSWFTVGVVTFDPSYDTFTIAGFDWRGTGSAVTNFAVSFTRATPIPGAVWLLGSGLIGLVGLRRKTRN